MGGKKANWSVGPGDRPSTKNGCWNVTAPRVPESSRLPITRAAIEWQQTKLPATQGASEDTGVMLYDQLYANPVLN